MKNPTLLRVALAALGALLLTSAAPTRAAEKRDARQKLVFLISEPEYDTAKSLPEFAAKFLKDFRVVTVSGTGPTPQEENTFDRIDEVADADVLFVSVRRRTPPKAQLDAIRRHVAAGKPVVGIRTASHSFALGKNQKLSEGGAVWPEWDAEVIGGNYSNHHGKGPPTSVTAANPNHPLLRGVTLPFTSESSLYKSSPLRAGAEAVAMGTIPGQAPEPIAWTFKRKDGGRTFYTSLGSVSDFKNPAFTQLLRNGIVWAATGK
jgi:type 1 glutamine amidotransferase